MKTFWVLVACSTLASCTATRDPQGLSSDAYRTEYAELDGRIVNVEITDEREGTTSRELKTPGMTFPWNDDEVRPELTDEERELISAELRRHFRGGEPLVARVRVLEGAQRFVAAMLNEGEEVEFRIALTIDPEGAEPSGAPVEGHAFSRYASLDASRDDIELMYLRAIAEGVAEAVRAWVDAGP